MTESGCKAVVQLLLEKGTDINHQNMNGETAPILVASRGYEAVLQLPLKQLVPENEADGVAVDKIGWMALHWAAWVGYEAVLWLLLEREANIDAENYDGRIALYWEARNGHEEVARLLLEKGLGIDTQELGRTDGAALGGHKWARGSRAVAAQEEV